MLCPANMLGYLFTIRLAWTGTVRRGGCPAHMLGYLCPTRLHPPAPQPMWSAAACRRRLPPGLPGRAPRIALATPISRLAPLLLPMFARWKGRTELAPSGREGPCHKTTARSPSSAQSLSQHVLDCLRPPSRFDRFGQGLRCQRRDLCKLQKKCVPTCITNADASSRRT